MKNLPSLGGAAISYCCALGEVRPGRSVGVDDALGEQIEHLLALVLRLIGGEHMIEAAILSDDDDDVLDGLAVLILSTAMSGSAAWPVAMQASAEAANAARPVAARRDCRMVIAMGILLE